MICGSRCLPHVPPRVLPEFIYGSCNVASVRVSCFVDIDAFWSEENKLYPV